MRDTYWWDVPWKPYRRTECCGGDLAIEGVRGGGRRQVVEEGGVEHGDVGDVGKQLTGDVDAGEVGRVVERGERREPVDRGDDVGIDQHGAGEVLRRP